LEEVLGLEHYVLGVHLVSTRRIVAMNREWLGHNGPTDVISIDYGEEGGVEGLQGDVFICPEEAVQQARLFQTTWQLELVRYLVHGVLHLRGFDDLDCGARRVMKREEDKVLRKLGRVAGVRYALGTIDFRSGRGESLGQS
jgi:rRNA maturation RNase YbeY